MYGEAPLLLAPENRRGSQPEEKHYGKREAEASQVIASVEFCVRNFSSSGNEPNFAS